MSRRAAGSCGPREAGFTLIEMIIALALLSLISAMLAGSVAGTRNVLAFIERNNAASAVLPAQGYLRSAFARTIPAKLGSGPSGRTPVLQGEPAHVRFKTFFAPRGQVEGLYDIEVGLAPATGRSSGFDLVVIQTLRRPAQADSLDAPVPVLRSTLATNVRSVSFSYFGVDEAEPDGWEWLDSWSSVERNPRLVRIDVTFGPGQTQNWRDVIFPLQLSE